MRFVMRGAAFFEVLGLRAEPSPTPVARRSLRSLRLGGAILLAVVALVAVGLHFFRIESLPRGFYVDETSIGYNAHRIAEGGVDEHGEPWPLFFRAFGEYKNPLYIYLVALDYKLLGYSPWATRAASAVCWLVGTWVLLSLGFRMFGDLRTRLYLLLCAGFTPWLFSLSRISFEVITLYPLLALHLWALYRGYEEDSEKDWAFAAGVSVALTVYAYSSFRLLGPLHVGIVLLCYPGRPYWRRHVSFLTGAALAAVPYAVYMARNYSALAYRFNYLTYLHDGSYSALTKLGMFLERYVGYLGPGFLVVGGDPNRRHHSGFGGELLAVTGLLLVLGLAAKLETRELWKRPFFRLLLAGLLISPVAASLTVEKGHSLRAFSLVVFALLLSAVGMNVLSQRPKKLLASIALAAVAINAFLYVHHYFVRYPTESVEAFETYGLREALEMAAGTARGKVVINEGIHRSETNLNFYAPIVANPKGVALRVGQESDVRPGDVYIQSDPEGRLSGLRLEGSRFVGLRFKQLRKLRAEAPRRGPVRTPEAPGSASFPRRLGPTGAAPASFAPRPASPGPASASFGVSPGTRVPGSASFGAPLALPGGNSASFTPAHAPFGRVAATQIGAAASFGSPAASFGRRAASFSRARASFSGARATFGAAAE